MTNKDNLANCELVGEFNPDFILELFKALRNSPNGKAFFKFGTIGSSKVISVHSFPELKAFKCILNYDLISLKNLPFVSSYSCNNKNSEFVFNGSNEEFLLFLKDNFQIFEGNEKTVLNFKNAFNIYVKPLNESGLIAFISLTVVIVTLFALLLHHVLKLNELSAFSVTNLMKYEAILSSLIIFAIFIYIYAKKNQVYVYARKVTNRPLFYSIVLYCFLFSFLLFSFFTV